jgi:hypothetical protein
MIINKNKKNYIRKGKNQDSGSDLQDYILVNKNGKVDTSTPILWDFNEITDITAYPVDNTELNITGGRFKTIANRQESKYNYHKRGFEIKRSKVKIIGMEHRIEGEGETGAPYRGFLTISKCAYVTVESCKFSGHKTYKTIGSAGREVNMGSYDITVERSVHITFKNCIQLNDFRDRTLWGIMSSNYSKCIVYKGCILSRFDAHKGVYNATITDTTLRIVSIIGHGKLILDNVKIYNNTFINFRNDYGATWEGNVLLKDCTFNPTHIKENGPAVFNGQNTGTHDFGYTCYLPKEIILDNFTIEDQNDLYNYKGPVIFGDFNKALKDPDYQAAYPLIPPEKVILKKITITSGADIRLSHNEAMFTKTEVSGL